MKLKHLEIFIACSMVVYIILLLVMNNTFTGTTRACNDMTKELQDMKTNPIKMEIKHITEVKETK